MTSWPRRIAWSLFVIGFIALVNHAGEFERMDAWGWLSLATLAAAPIVGFRQRSGWRWLLASVPFWIYGSSHEWITLTAVGLTIASMAAAAVGPTLVGRRARRSNAGAAPLPHLARGPLTPITPRVFSGGQRSRFLHYAAIALAVTALVLFIAAASGWNPDETTALGISAVIIAATFAFGNWFADRVRLRIDASGVHGRTLFREHSARWNEITGLRLRYLFMPGYSIRLVYYVVETARAEVSFPSSMRGAKELQAVIEAATGVQWPEPEITATM